MKGNGREEKGRDEEAEGMRGIDGALRHSIFTV
jgi:hypothetical protein